MHGRHLIWLGGLAGLLGCAWLEACGATPVSDGSGSTGGGAGGHTASTSLLAGAGDPPPPTGGQVVQSGAPTESNNCGAQKHDTTRATADVLLVLDTSGSMKTSTDKHSTRYKDVVAALDQVLPQTDDAINWGLELFPRITGGRSDDGCTPGQVDVSIKAHNAKAVAAAYDPNVVSPDGNTPTTESVKNAVKALQALNDGNPKYIVLATDGGPNCNPDEWDTEASDATHAIAAVRAAAQANIPVFVVGLSVGSTASATLNKMAEAGGKPIADPTDSKTKYYKANTSDELVVAINAIRGQVATCIYNLPSLPPEPSNVLVVYDDHRALPSPTTWGYTDASNTSITIYGDDCAKVMDGTYKSVQILYGCKGDNQLIP